MEPALVQVAAVASCYYLWKAYAWWFRKRQQQLRNRVAYMLWVAAQHVRC